MLTKAGHLTYCSNIHPGADWDSHFAELKANLPYIREKVAHDGKLAIGLRCAHEAALELEKPERLAEFREWLEENQLYVFCINGFPYGTFHQSVVKDYVHAPDWTTSMRLEYTRRLFRILAALLPENMTGAVSTPPLSYRRWWKTEQNLSYAKEKATANLLELVDDLIDLTEKTGRIFHVDIEPEPDGILDNGKDFFTWYREILIPRGKEFLANRRGYNSEQAHQALLNHVRLCYDVCHFAVSYESAQWVVDELKKSGIKVGRLQLSSALRIDLDHNRDEKLGLLARQFREPVYLHQVVARTKTGELIHYPDLDAALEADHSGQLEWRVHFHVPLFIDDYGLLNSTQSDLKELLELHKNEPLTEYLEIETYTWGVLPESLQLPISDSIVRELNWVKEQLKVHE